MASARVVSSVTKRIEGRTGATAVAVSRCRAQERSAQTPTNSRGARFMAQHSTQSAMLRRGAAMNGKTIVITGGSSGIGAAAARELRKRGANVVITGRSAATAQLANEIGADYVLADFARFCDVRALAETLLAKYPRIDVLANNAGGLIAGREITEDGHEKTMQVNHLAPFFLTLLLRERLEASSATVINTASGAH